MKRNINKCQTNFGKVLVKAYVTILNYFYMKQNESMMMLLLIYCQLFERQRMNSNQRTIEYEDTSFKKYPFNKYYDYKELNHVSRRVFDDKLHSQTIDTHALRKKSKRSKSKHQHPRPSRKSVNTAKTMSSSRLKFKHQRANLSITLDNCKEFSKNQIAEELHHYTKLCLNLRKENQSLQEKLEDNKRNNKENLVELQRKLNKLNEKTLQMKEKELLIEESRLHDVKNLKKNKESISITNKGKSKYIAKEGQFKRFFLHFIDNFGRLDEKLHRKIVSQKSLEHKLVFGQRMLKESCEFLREKKYKFNCIFD